MKEPKYKIGDVVRPSGKNSHRYYDYGKIVDIVYPVVAGHQCLEVFSYICAMYNDLGNPTYDVYGVHIEKQWLEKYVSSAPDSISFIINMQE